MKEIFEKVLDFFSKAYVYVPTIGAFIVGVALPALSKIAKIVSEAKENIARARTLKEKSNACVNGVNQTNAVVKMLIDNFIEDKEDEIEFLKTQLGFTYNPQLKIQIENRINRLSAKIEFYKSLTVGQLIELITDSELKLPTKKLKVKVVKDNGTSN